MWTDSTTVLQRINSNEKQAIFVANRVCKILGYTRIDQWNHAATNDNPADAGTRGLSAEVLQLSSSVNGSHLLTNSRFPFVPNKHVINNIKLGVNQAVTIEDTVSLASSVKKRKLPFLEYFSLISLVLIKSTCAWPSTFSGFCRNTAATVTSMVALLTLLSLTKPSVIYSTWCKESLLKLKGNIFLTINMLNGATESLHFHRS